MKTHPKMALQLLLALGLGSFFLSCDLGKTEKLETQIDSLKIELEKSYKTSQTLAEVGVLLDSIDATRRLLRVNLVEGTQYDDFSGRMQELNAYIARTEEKIATLERSLNSSNAWAKSLSKNVAQLKAELARKTDEIAFLKEEVEKYRHENENLMITVNLQDAEIADKQAQIDARNQELALIEARVQELLIQAKVSEADAYYTRAEAIEIAAERTKLAPRKRRETLQEALDLYKKALSLGNSKAEAKIAKLKERL